jgi:hypothetical protein
MVTHDLVSEDDIAKLIIPDGLPDESSFKAYIEAKVYDKEGHLIHHHRQPMRSFTQYFLALMSIPILGTWSGPTSGTAQDILINVLGLPSNSGAYASIAWNWSIQLGSGTQTFSLSLNSLAAPILNGTGAGELSYQGLSVTYAGTSIFITLTVANYTSASVTVSEIGLQGTIYIYYYQSSSTSYSFLLSYDTFSTPITVPASGMAVFQITLSFTG